MQSLEFIKNIGIIILGALCIYIQCNKKIQEKIAEVSEKAICFINDAEAMYTDAKQGGEKMKWVVEELFKRVPSPLKRIINKDMIQDIVQSIFDQIDTYAKEQFDKIVNKG